ncbi:MAG: PspC domain-containing protein [Candidatus Pacebacteria bacterium]|nr:PspC domain-containing protein [Candidatus Paceibacterota bacterium]
MKKIYLSTCLPMRQETNRKISGVCGGIGEAYNIDPVLIRTAFILIAATTAFLPAFIAYLLIAWFVIPKEK